MKKLIIFSIVFLSVLQFANGQTVTTRFKCALVTPELNFDTFDTALLKDVKIGDIPKGKELQVIEIDTVRYLFYKVEYKNKIGYIHHHVVTDNSYILERNPNIREKFYSLIKRRAVTLGMNKTEVYASMGHPTKSNRTVTQNGVSEQWVYPNDIYVYLEDDIVTAFQD